MKRMFKLNLKQDKGAATALVIFTVIMFVTILSGTYLIIMAKAKAQLKSDVRIQDVYLDDVINVNEIYNEIVDNYLERVTVTFNANGGTGVMDNFKIIKGRAGNLPAVAFIKNGSTFRKWTTNADGTGTSYNNGEEVTLESDLTLYAQWAEQYTITYNLGGGTASNPITYFSDSENFTLNNPTKDGYTFIGWTVDEDDTPVKSVTIETGTTGNKTYTANWASSSFGNNYTQLDYIESTGTQYINTGIYPKSNTKVVCDLQYTENVGNCNNGWGSSGSQEAYMWGINSVNFCTFVSSQWSYQNSSVAKDLNRHVFNLSSGSQKFDGTEFGTSTIGDTATSSQTMYLFANHVEWNNVPEDYCKERIYYCKILEGNILVREFIPCKRNSDNKPGLYDAVTNSFYVNLGLGEFTM